MKINEAFFEIMVILKSTKTEVNFPIIYSDDDMSGFLRNIDGSFAY